MISPGCSFTFPGLKDVLLAVKPRIEAKIKQVFKLGINYRVTKDVLDVSNVSYYEMMTDACWGFVLPYLMYCIIPFHIKHC